MARRVGRGSGAGFGRPLSARALSGAQGSLPGVRMVLVSGDAGAGNRHRAGGPAGIGRPLYLPATDWPFRRHRLVGGRNTGALAGDTELAGSLRRGGYSSLRGVDVEPNGSLAKQRKPV